MVASDQILPGNLLSSSSKASAFELAGQADNWFDRFLTSVAQLIYALRYVLRYISASGQFGDTDFYLNEDSQTFIGRGSIRKPLNAGLNSGSHQNASLPLEQGRPTPNFTASAAYKSIFPQSINSTTNPADDQIIYLLSGKSPKVPLPREYAFILAIEAISLQATFHPAEIVHTYQFNFPHIPLVFDVVTPQYASMPLYSKWLLGALYFTIRNMYGHNYFNEATCFIKVGQVDLGYVNIRNRVFLDSPVSGSGNVSGISTS